MAPRSAKPRARPEGSGRRARGPNARPGPRRCAALRLNACTDGAAPLHLVPGSVAPRRPFRRCAFLEHPRAKHSALTRCASLRSLRPRLALSVSLRCTPITNRPASASLRPVARRLARRANQNQQLRKSSWLKSHLQLPPRSTIRVYCFFGSPRLRRTGNAGHASRRFFLPRRA
jgi:hypothetical protein